MKQTMAVMPAQFPAVLAFWGAAFFDLISLYASLFACPLLFFFGWMGVTSR
jgi:hypothetical protein